MGNKIDTGLKLDHDRIINALREGGDVASRLPSYEPRQAQLDLLSLIIKGFNEDAVVMAEAGTGVGKSFAYLLPAMHFAVLNSGKKQNRPVVISTATITLQRQLYEKDIPLVASGMGDVKIKSVIMKGRGNYLCLRRFDDALKEPPLFDFDYEELKNISHWADKTKTGEKSEIDFLPSDSVWGQICSESDLCLGNYCPWRSQCFILALRKEANNAHIIVVNHHLLFADLAARFQGAGYESTVILPPFERLIIDEAHTIENAASSFFSAEFARTGIFRQLGRLYRKRKANKQGLLIKLCAMLPGNNELIDELADAVKKIRTSAEDLDDNALEICGAQGILRLSPSLDESFLKKAFFPHLKKLKNEITKLTGMVRDIIENFPEEKAADPVVWETRTIMRRLENVAEICDVFCKYRKHENDVLWMEKIRASKEPWVVFSRTPLDLAPILKDSVFSPCKSVICVSATLAINDDFSFWRGRSGVGLLKDRNILSGCFLSPFPYSNAVLLASPTDAPLPDEEGYQDFINHAAENLASCSGGSALVLFTSYQSLSKAYDYAKDKLTAIGIRCLKQGGDDRSRLLKEFLSDKTSCLFATDSFWEGVDAPGDTLRMVIICRLPFRTPGDPVFEARCEAVEKDGGSSFMQLSLPHAVMKFKQGFGRLMRRSADHGVVVVLDGRILKKAYGRLFLDSLPETKTSFSCLDNILINMENFLY